MPKTTQSRCDESETSDEIFIKRFPYLWGGNASFRRLSAANKLGFLSNQSRSDRVVYIGPDQIYIGENFYLEISKSKKIAFIRTTIKFPSGRLFTLDYKPEKQDTKKDRYIIGPFSSAYAGSLYADVRIYFTDGTTKCDAILAIVFSKNPLRLTITPRIFLDSGNAGRVEYDWDEEKFHCRAYAEITNNSDRDVAFNYCEIQVFRGSDNSHYVDTLSFDTNFHVVRGDHKRRTIDLWMPKDSAIGELFNTHRSALYFKFTYSWKIPFLDPVTPVSDQAVYKPMSTIPVNIIDTRRFSNAQEEAEQQAIEIAKEIFEQYDITLNRPRWQIIRSPIARLVYSTITIGYLLFDLDVREMHEMFENISGTGDGRLDIFIVSNFVYTSNVPEDKRILGKSAKINGPKHKSADEWNSGVMVKMKETNPEGFGCIIAHEICHYLGLKHNSQSRANLMGPVASVANSNLTDAQIRTINQHGMMKWIADMY